MNSSLQITVYGFEQLFEPPIGNASTHNICLTTYHGLPQITWLTSI
jgi:hypothetical protein